MKLPEAVAIYVQKKRDNGRDYYKVAQLLNSLARTLGDIELSGIKAHHVAAFLNRRAVLPATWYHKYMRIRGLFRYWAARGEFQRLPLPRKRASRPTEFYPHVFSRTQIKKLLTKAPVILRASWCVLQPQTLQNLILFLYGSGLYVGEAVRIQVPDLDFQNSTVKIRGVSGHDDRIVPLGNDVKALIAKHLKASTRSVKKNHFLFETKLGGPLNRRTLDITFRRLCKAAKIGRRSDSVYQPRLHDLRHTFAVHRIILWCQQKATLPRMLPLLAAYMGMSTVTAMEKYLLLAPAKYIPQVRQVG